MPSSERYRPVITNMSNSEEDVAAMRAAVDAHLVTHLRDVKTGRVHRIIAPANRLSITPDDARLTKHRFEKVDSVGVMDTEWSPTGAIG